MDVVSTNCSNPSNGLIYTNSPPNVRKTSIIDIKPYSNRQFKYFSTAVVQNDINETPVHLSSCPKID